MPALAYLVGINKYDKNSLRACINDAEKVKEILQLNGNKSANINSHVFPDFQKGEELRTLITELFNTDIETVVFYYSGHGGRNEKGVYLATNDSLYGNPPVYMDEILEFANKSRAENKIIILDCCYSGQFGSPTTINHNSIDAEAARNVLEITQIAAGVSVLAASRSDEEAKENSEHSVFTSLLLKALDGGAADVRGNITIASTYNFIEQSLGKNEQRPVFKTNICNSFVLRKVIPKVPTDYIKNLIHFFPDPNKPKRLNPSYEPTNNLDYIHQLIPPYTDKDNKKIFSQLQDMVKIGLVEPENAEHMYFAAMHNEYCRLTDLGQHYWRLANEGKLE